MRTKFEVRSFTRSWNNWMHPKNRAVSGYAHAPFSPKFLTCFCLNGPCEASNVPAKFEIRTASSVPEITAIGVLGGIANTNLGEKEAVWGRVWYRSKERGWVPIYRPSITFPLSLRVSKILPLLCSSTPLFPTSPLVSPKFPHVLLGVGGWPLV